MENTENKKLGIIKRTVPFILFMLFSSGCASLFKDIEVSSLMQKKRYHDVIRIIQPDIDRKEAISSFQLYLLSGAYYEIRGYTIFS